MDFVEFKRLTSRVVATRNSESRAFLKAFDVAPGITSRWAERSCANWRLWSSADDALRDAVVQLETFLGADGPQAKLSPAPPDPEQG
jgi:DNA polymerase I-like protein with 3'-5' exonuclease and polymerase domains